MRVSILLQDQKDARNEILARVHELGVTVSPEKESDIKLVIGEALTNCLQGERCVGNWAEVEVLSQDSDIVVAINAPCYEDPEEVKGWFGCACEEVDPLSEHGRGGGIMNILTKGIIIRPGSIKLVFDPLSADRMASTAA